MKALIWENEEYHDAVTPDGVYPVITDDMNEPCTCPNCGKTFRFGEMYTSRKWFRGNGAFGFYVCGDCYRGEPG